MDEHQFGDDAEKGCVSCGCQAYQTRFNMKNLLHPRAKCPGTDERKKAIVLLELIYELERKLDEADQQNFQLDSEKMKKEYQIGLLEKELKRYKSDPKNQGRTISALIKDRDQTADVLEKKIKSAIATLTDNNSWDH
jgi:hypothetical protein